MSGKRQKHPDALVYRRGGRVKALELVANATTTTIPQCPRGLRKEARSAWVTLWSSRLAGAYKDTDIPGLRRWAFWTSEWWRALSETRKAEPEMNAVSRYLKLCETNIRELEKAYGMDPLARLRLGLTLAEEQTAVMKLKRTAIPREMSG